MVVADVVPPVGAVDMVEAAMTEEAIGVVTIPHGEAIEVATGGVQGGMHRTRILSTLRYDIKEIADCSM